MGLLTLFCMLRSYITMDQKFSYNFEISIFVEGNVYVFQKKKILKLGRQDKTNLKIQKKNIKLLNNSITIEDILIGCALQ